VNDRSASYCQARRFFWQEWEFVEAQGAEKPGTLSHTQALRRLWGARRRWNHSMFGLSYDGKMYRNSSAWLLASV